MGGASHRTGRWGAGGALVAAVCLTATATTAFATAPEKPSPRIGHVFVINLENKGFDETFGSSGAPYLSKTLTSKGQLLTQYFAIGHASLDNYIAQISGQGPNPATQSDCTTFSEFASTGVGELGQELGEGCVYPASVKTVADQLDAAHRTWRTYQEDMGNSSDEPKTCRHPNIGSTDPTESARSGDQYATKHNPFVYFHSIIDSPQCNENVVPLDVLDADLSSAKKTPNLVYITPNLCHDGHDKPCVDGQFGGLVSADRWLREWTPKILASPAFKRDGVLIVTFDEAELSGSNGDSSACCGVQSTQNAAKPGLNGPGGGRTGAVVISRFTKPGTKNAKPYNHYALLCSIENAFGLDHLGLAGQPGLGCFGKDVYNR
jgi:phosphatidylinositol-3-phosphatase